jgi:hypothetical protein
MSIEENKAVVGQWFAEFWGKDFNPAAPPRQDDCDHRIAGFTLGG